MTLNFPDSPADGDIFEYIDLGKKRYFVYKSAEQKWTQIVISDEQQKLADFVPPTNISELINDGIFFSELSRSLIVDALGYIPRSVDDSNNILTVPTFLNLSRSSSIAPGTLSFVEDTKDIYVATGTPDLYVPKTRYELTPGETFSFEVSFVDVWSRISKIPEDEDASNFLDTNLLFEQSGDDTICTISRLGNVFTVTANETPVNGLKTLLLTLEIGTQTLTKTIEFAFGIAYSLTADSQSFDEGEVVTIRLTTTGVVNGLEIPYTIQGISLEDTNLDSLTGSFLINDNFFSSLSFTIISDLTTEGPETIALALDNGEASIQIDITDTSTTPTYDLVVEPSNVDEGNSVTFTLNTTQIPNNTFVPYTITGSGITAADFGSNSLQDSFLIVDNTASVTLTIREDLKTEGVETFALSLDTAPVTQEVVINDTSIDPPPVFQLLTTSNSINEGESFTITINTQYVPVGDLVQYTVSGIDGADLLAGQLTGSFLIEDAGGDRLGTDSLNFVLKEDVRTEGLETFRLSLDNGKGFIDVSIADTSQAPVFNLSPTSENVDEGQTITITLTTDAADGTNVPYTITGIDVNDISLDSLTGSFTAVSGTDTLQFTIINDESYQEGNETFVLTLNDDESVGTTLFIGDTSFVVPEFTLSSSLTEQKLNQSNTITLTTTFLENGTTVPYTITGLDAADLQSGSLTGFFIINSNTSSVVIELTDNIQEDKIYTLALNNGQDSISVSVNSSPILLYEPFSPFTVKSGFRSVEGNQNFELENLYLTSEYPWISNEDFYKAAGFFDGSGGNSGQIITIPSTGSYRIQAAGGTGGSAYLLNTNTVNLGGKAADLTATFNLSSGDKLFILVGSKGYNNPRNDRAGSGGGATFLYHLNSDTLLMVAGGGGGSGQYGYSLSDANINSTSGNPGQSRSVAGGAGGTNGEGGESAVYAGGGGGWLTDGGLWGWSTLSNNPGGRRLVNHDATPLRIDAKGGEHYNGASGATNSSTRSDDDSSISIGKPGGFGGGGGCYAGAGGGGGYSGGGAGAWSRSGGGGGGGCYIDTSATNVVRALTTEDESMGFVTITLL